MIEKIIRENIASQLRRLPVRIVMAVILGAAAFYYVTWTYNRTPVEQEYYGVVAGDVKYYGDTVGYLAEPSTPGTYPGLILIHEWWGKNENIEELANQYASKGYVALAVDLYGGETTRDPAVARELATNVRSDMDGAFENLKAAVEYLKAREGVQSDRLASIGWCFGGGWSYEMAKNDLGVKSSVIYYGQFNPQDDLDQMRTKILGHFGEDDQSILISDVVQFRAKLETLSGEHQVFIYPNAGHAFANDDSAAHVPEAAGLAWDRTIEFLKESL